MAYTEANKVQIRKYLGFSALFMQEDPRLEQAMIATQSIADGGTRPDNSTELEVMATVTKLQALDLKIEDLEDQASVATVEGININAAYGIGTLNARGRRLVTVLATLCGLKGPRKDIFSPSAPMKSDDWIFNV